MKRIFIIALIFLVVLGAVFFFTQSMRRAPAEKQSSGPQQPVTRVPPPDFPRPVARKQPDYVVSLASPAPSRPVQAYSAVFPSDFDSYALTLASAFGFSGTSQKISLSAGTVHLWTKGASSLSVGGDPIGFSYATDIEPAGIVALTNTRLDAIAKQALQRVKIPSSPLGLTPLPADYFAPRGNDLGVVPAQQQATLVQVNYAYTVGDVVPFAMRTPGLPAASVRINAQGRLVSMNAYIFPVITKTDASLSFVSQADALKRLINKEGLLLNISADVDRNEHITRDYSLSSSTITSSTLEYYYSQGNSVLAPVYIFGGAGVDATTGKRVQTTTVVSALPSLSTK